MYDFIIYDFDGTLSDSYPVYADALMILLERYGLHMEWKEGYALLKVSVGHALRQFDFGKPIKNISVEFNKIYHELARASMEAIPGAVDILRFATEHDKKNYIYTHTGKFAFEMLDKMKLSPYVDYVLDSSAGFARKPVPVALYFLFEKCGIDPSRALMVGDRDIDVEAAHNAGIHGCLFDPGDYYPDCRAEYRINGLLELEKIV